jgi:methylthioribose-1-phosphate isomerase
MNAVLPRSVKSFNTFSSKVVALVLSEEGAYLLDQTLLPLKVNYVLVNSSQDMASAIQTMRVRGAPAIGIAAAYGVVLACRESLALQETIGQTLSRVGHALKMLAETRPTAVNLFWALNRMKDCLNRVKTQALFTQPVLLEALTEEALAIHQEDIEACYAIGQLGSTLVKKTGAGILTHCNAGALATGGYGTALGVVRAAFAKDPTLRVYADETRPRQQGARLTTWELLEDGIPTTLVTDGMSGSLMQSGAIDMVIVGADRIAANGDVANKIGTYNLAIVAKAHNIPFYVAAPCSTMDVSLDSGQDIPIEYRDNAEIGVLEGVSICHPDTAFYNPGFDITPARYITGIITEKAILKAPFCLR